jgi:aspartate/methionine/tyrosine aminotransferase
MALPPEAKELNKEIGKTPFLALLSKTGKGMYFPRNGFVQQSLDAAGKSINATAGVANEDDGSVMHLALMGEKVSFPPEKAFSYSPSSGNAELRGLWKKSMLRKSPSIRQDISNPIVTCGITHAIHVAAFLFAEKGVDVVIPDLYWENYALLFGNVFGAKLKTFPMFLNGRFNISGMEEAIKSSKRPIVLLNFPNNPTGYTPLEEEADAIAKAIGRCARHRPLVAICDDAYFGLVYLSGVFRESIFSRLIKEENVLAIKCDGATKECFAWGLRVGFITFGAKGGPPALYSALEKKAIGAIRASVSSAPTLSQSLVTSCLADPAQEWQKAGKFGILKARFQEVNAILSEDRFREWLEPLPFNSGYFMCMEPKHGIDAEKLRKLLLGKYGTGVIAIGGKIRIAYSALPKTGIRKAFENIVSACKELKNRRV